MGGVFLAGQMDPEVVWAKIGSEFPRDFGRLAIIVPVVVCLCFWMGRWEDVDVVVKVCVEAMKFMPGGTGPNCPEEHVFVAKARQLPSVAVDSSPRSTSGGRGK